MKDHPHIGLTLAEIEANAESEAERYYLEHPLGESRRADLTTDYEIGDIVRYIGKGEFYTGLSEGDLALVTSVSPWSIGISLLSEPAPSLIVSDTRLAELVEFNHSPLTEGERESARAKRFALHADLVRRALSATIAEPIRAKLRREAFILAGKIQ